MVVPLPCHRCVCSRHAVSAWPLEFPLATAHSSRRLCGGIARDVWGCGGASGDSRHGRSTTRQSASGIRRMAGRQRERQTQACVCVCVCGTSGQ
ncbi:hypothetical protein BKA81DRAFT_372558 [Phyllosticta paracitricarpa]